MQSRQTWRPETPGTGQQFVHVDSREGRVIAHFVGPVIGERETMIISEQINRMLGAVGDDLRVLVLDFSDVEAVSSMGLGMCIDLRNTAKSAGAKTVIFGLNRRLSELFSMMKVERLCQVASTEQELEKVL